MEDLHLNETVTRYFGDLFLCCDEKSNEKIPILKAVELFRSSNIPNDILNKIMDISVAPLNQASMDHMNRRQFYTALKLIAAHQSNMPLKPDLVTAAVELPLPRFTWALNSEANANLIQMSSSPKHHHTKRDRKIVPNVLAYEPIPLSSNLSDSDAPPDVSNDATDGLSTDSEIESETLSQRSGSRVRHAKDSSPWSTTSRSRSGSASPTPTNSVAERAHPVWESSATGRGVWPASTAEEHTQLLGTEEESSDRHSSEEEPEAEEQRWAVSEAQARHYAAQFRQLRPERGLIPGHVAKLFFEKSRLSVTDLRKIWQLADINKDGMLSLEEFSIAMHLIVLRRKDVPVPDVLPACLVPKVDSNFSQQAVTTDLVDLGADMFSSGTSADFNFTKDEYEGKKDERQMSMSPPKEQQNNKEWTKFVDSPTSSLSSPGPKPVNFDFQKSAVERDPKIYHPVALRVTPEVGAMSHGDGDVRASASPRRDDIALAFEPPSPKRVQSQPPLEPPPNGVTAEIKSIQRPQPKKVVKTGVGALPPPPAREPHGESAPPPRKEPPPPPPRPRHHARSSSLDLTRLKGAAPPPQPPPRVSPSTSSASTSTSGRRLLNQRSEGEPAFPPETFVPREYEGEGFGLNRDDPPKMHGAFEVYRKPSSRESSYDTEPDIKALQEQNAVLHRVCRALHAELAEVQREREALKLKLESHSTSV